jgi:hypothetical protein
MEPRHIRGAGLLILSRHYQHRHARLMRLGWLYYSVN